MPLRPQPTLISAFAQPGHSVHNRSALPAQPTPFILRTHELHAVVDALRQPNIRLLTLVGSGGIGKTRLALAVAELMTPIFADGTWFVDLSAIRDAALVFPTIAHTLGVQDDGRRTPVERLDDYLRERQALLVLDNCEQVLEAAADIARMLSACVDVKVLATSREPLRLRWEHAIRVPPLGLTAVDQPAAGGLAQIPAIGFFVQRAQAADPAFALTEENQAAVAELCARLDGLPLALELAAARVRALPPALLLSRLDQQLDLLEGPPDAPARQQSLRATVEWSYDLLTSDDQLMFRRLGVFTGGCTLEAANVVCHEYGESDVLVGLAALVDKSLLRHERDAEGGVRFRLHETMRHVAFEKLEAAGEAEGIQIRYADHFLGLAEAAEHETWGRNAAIWLDRLEREHANFRAALTWLVATQRISKACLLAAALEPLWDVRGHLTEGQRWLQASLAAADEAVAVGARARAFAALGLVTLLLGDSSGAFSLAQESVTLARVVGDPERLCLNLWFFGEAARTRGEDEAARAALEETLTLARTRGLTVPAGCILGLLGRLAYNEGKHREGRALLEQAVTILEPTRSARGLMDALRMLGAILIEEGEVTRGRQLMEEAVSICRALGERWSLIGCLTYLGYAAVQQGDLTAARALLTECAQLGQGSGDMLNPVRYLGGFARLAVAERQWERAVRLAGAAAGILGVTGAGMPHSLAKSVERWLEPARAALGTRAADVWAAGRRLSVAQATAYALSSDATGTSAGSLTSRELEVADLVGRGLTNRQIAEALVIAPSTAERHLANIMNKLAMTSRTQVGVWASKHSVFAAQPGHT